VVAQRTREVGIRRALGAARGNVLWMVMREVLLLVACAAGYVLALRASRLDPMAALRYE
jgi:ABC-type antimicrobial peptide transport system permease subunit